MIADVGVRIPYLEARQNFHLLLPIHNLLVHLTPDPPLGPRNLCVLLQERIDEQPRGVLEWCSLVGWLLSAIFLQRPHLPLLYRCMRGFDGKYQHLGANAQLSLPAQSIQAPDEGIPVGRGARHRIGVPVGRNRDGTCVALVGVDDGEVLGFWLWWDRRLSHIVRSWYLVFTFFYEKRHSGGRILRTPRRKLRLANT